MRFLLGRNILTRYPVRWISTGSSGPIDQLTTSGDQSGYDKHRKIAGAFVGLIAPFLGVAYWLREQMNEVEILHRKPMVAHYLISNSEDIDFGKICYRKDGTFSKESQLDLDNQQKFIDFVKVVKQKVGKLYPEKRVEIVPLLYSPSNTDSEPCNDIFSFVSIYDGSNDRFDLLSKLSKTIYNVDDSAVYVFINTAAFFENIVVLSQLYKEIHEDLQGCLNMEAPADCLFRYFRSLTMSSNQRELILDLNLMLHQFYTAEYPSAKVSYISPLICYLSGAIPSVLLYMNLYALLFGVCATFFVAPFMNAIFYAKYEQKKRSLVHSCVDKLSAGQLSALMTHLYRVQDHEVNAKECYKRPESSGMFTAVGMTMQSLMSMITQYTYMESPIAIPSRTEYLESVVNHCRARSRGEKIELITDPYEVYKDDEGFDYVFVS